MAATPTKPRTRRAKGAPTLREPEAEAAQWSQPPLGLSPVGEYFRRIAGERTPGAVQVDQYRQHGAPVLDDTRIPVSYVLGELAAGKSWAEITATYPAVTEARIRAALEFADAVFRQPQAIDLE